MRSLVRKADEDKVHLLALQSVASLTRACGAESSFQKLWNSAALILDAHISANVKREPACSLKCKENPTLSLKHPDCSG